MPSGKSTTWAQGSTSPVAPTGAGAIVAAAAAGVVAGVSVAMLIAVLWTRREEKRDTEGKVQPRGWNLTDAERGASKSPATAVTGTSVAEAGRRSSRRSAGSWHEADLTPPLPDDVVRLLRASRLCFLSTFCDDHPHLSLMNFTYHAEDEVIILSTRRDTKKYAFMQTARNVAILVHEFPATGKYSPQNSPRKSPAGPGVNNQQNSAGSKVTITLNGSASIQEGTTAEKYRGLHVRKNPDSKRFIVGPNIAIITVRVKTARICNVRDEVTFWDVAETGSN